MELYWIKFYETYCVNWQHFLKPYSCFGVNVKVDLDLSSYSTKADLKEATKVDRSNLAAKLDLASLKAEVDKIDIDKLKTVFVDVSKLSNEVNNEIVKKTAYDKLAAKSNTTDTSGFVLITKYDTDKSNLEKKSRTLTRKYLMLVGLFKKDHNAKITEIEGKMPSVTGLATTASLNGVENKTFHICDIVKKTEHDATISDIESKYFTAANYDKFTSKILDAKIKQKELVLKSAIAGFINNADLDKKH